MTCPTSPTVDLILLRNASTEWSDKGVFTGWYDAKLNENGIEQAKKAGSALKNLKYEFHYVFTSALDRAVDTAQIILEELGQSNVPIIKTWKLNQRHMGFLTGMNKVEVAQKYGEEQYAKWNRGYDIYPPPMEPDHPNFSDIIADPRYDREEVGYTMHIPQCESIHDTFVRTLKIYNGRIKPYLKDNMQVLVCAHSLNLMAIIQKLENLIHDETTQIWIPNCVPMLYSLKKGELEVDPPGSTFQILGTPLDIVTQSAEVENQRKGVRVPYEWIAKCRIFRK